MTFPKLAPLAVIAAMAATSAMAEITVTDAYAFETAPTAMAGGGFLTITNTGDSDDVLTAVQADFPSVQLHTTEFDGDIARMMHLEAIPVAAGETVTLAPGGMHVMFMGLQGNPLTAGDEISATLVFEQAGEMPVTFDVVARDTADSHGEDRGHNHDQNSHDHGNSHDH
ncbi:MAG: copper chaperone PCu(A)C [Loktanella sp.]|nr:copper chaperone PCu(A)C [Loktanella sp.]